MSIGDAVQAVIVGLIAGVLSGMFGVGGGIVMTPGIDWAFPTVAPIEALETPLPVIIPTSITGAVTYAKAGEVDRRAGRWMMPTGLIGAVLGALATRWVEPTLLLLVTAVLLGYQSVGIIRGKNRRSADDDVAAGPPISGARLGGIGLAAGVVSGLMGIGGGIVMVPLLSGWCRMPLKRALGTSLLTIPAMVIPGTIVHASLGDIAWGIAVFMTIGAVPGARIGARIALGTAERTLRTLVGGAMLAVASGYGVSQIATLAGNSA